MWSAIKTEFDWMWNENIQPATAFCLPSFYCVWDCEYLNGSEVIVTCDKMLKQHHSNHYDVHAFCGCCCRYQIGENYRIIMSNLEWTNV